MERGRVGAQVVFTADDFGSSAAVNAAVVLARQEGVLTSASLEVTGPAVDEAVALARELPGLAVGLHLVVVQGRPALPPEEIPHLVDRSGNFPADPFLVGLRYSWDQAARREVAREVTAQFERFAATGLPLSHVDGHLHMHLHPALLDLVLSLAQRYGARGIRIPRDQVRFALSYNPRGAGSKISRALALGLLSRHALTLLRGSRLAVTERVYGLVQSGQMEEPYTLRLLQRMRVRTAELYFHPTTSQERIPLGPNPGDLETLLSPALLRVCEERQIHPTSYPALREEALCSSSC